MHLKIPSLIQRAFVVLLLVGGVCLKLALPEHSIASKAAGPVASRSRWMHPQVIEQLDRRMKQHHGQLRTSLPAKRRVCCWGVGDCCGIPYLADLWPMPEPFGKPTAEHIQLPKAFQAVR